MPVVDDIVLLAHSCSLPADIGQFLENEHNNMWNAEDRKLWKGYIGMVFTFLEH